ncbi:hypothetical protein [Sulfurimonas sp.]|jgi:hypothetical protein|uniref:hypothetical protein n=1 Tax=Sulfurimonas sp. TaxID=2022749 RepID=UPI002A36D9E1|nr:hypothetical protein [Sulfurimonas sp.]MDY0122743.1 hypothetical protein [Sulfurimonas sp.]
MREEISLAIIQSISDSQQDLIVVFEDDAPIVINRAFKKFFAVSSLDDYKEEFGPFVNNFVPHPSYFHSEKIAKGSNWVDAILELDDSERIVSMMTSAYEPHAFLVKLRKIEGYVIAVFEDITQTLIKRIMIENNASIDQQSGAYAKNYFLHIAQSYQDAASFNKKIISAILIKCETKTESELPELVKHFKGIIRQDDMLIRWEDDSLLLIYLVDNLTNAQRMMDKIYTNGCSFTLITQKEKESIKEFIKRID